MKKIVTLAAIGGALLFAAPASAKQTEPGVPGQPNCVGQTNAYLAQAFKDGFGAPGLGNVADLTGLTVPEVHAIVEAFCA
jgi:hypothetical protein